jgi:O-antigen/teichoic acid export membrane protein
MCALNVTGTPTGVLRVFNRFDVLACRPVLVGTTKFVAAVWLVVYGGTVTTVAWSFAMAELVGSAWLVGFAAIELRRRGVTSIPSPAEIRNAWPAFRAFVFVGKVDSAARLVSRYADMFLLGLLSTIDQVGLYRISVQVASMVGRLSDPLTQAVFPQFARLAAQGRLADLRRKSLRMLVAASAAAAIALLAFWLGGDWGIRTVFGTEFASATTTTAVYLVAVAIAIATLPVVPTLQALGQMRACMSAQLVATAVYLVALVPAVSKWGAVGAAGSYVLYYSAWVVGIGVPYRQQLTNREALVKLEPAFEGGR